jgi:translation elongation factor EF-G
MTTTTWLAPIMQVRVIGPDRYTHAVLADLTRRVETLLGGTPHTCHTHTRTARRLGHVRVYLTITPRETTHDHHP